MKYNIMIAMLLVTPISYCGDDIEINMRIKQIEDARFKKEEEIAVLSRKILEEVRLYFEYRELALRYWVALEGQNKESSFDIFNIKLCEAFEAGEDTKAICSNAPLIAADSTNSYLTMLRVALQFLFIDRLTSQYKLLVGELIDITKALNFSRLK